MTCITSTSFHQYFIIPRYSLGFLISKGKTETFSPWRGFPCIAMDRNSWDPAFNLSPDFTVRDTAASAGTRWHGQKVPPLTCDLPPVFSTVKPSLVCISTLSSPSGTYRVTPKSVGRFLYLAIKETASVVFLSSKHTGRVKLAASETPNLISCHRKFTTNYTAVWTHRGVAVQNKMWSQVDGHTMKSVLL